MKDQSKDTDTQAPRGIREWTLWPNRALDRKGVQRLIAFFVFLLGVGVIRSFVLGAWPVAIFLLVDLGAICLALGISIRRTKWRENVALTPNRLIITRSLGEQVSDYRELSPADARLRLTLQDGRHRLEVRDDTQGVSIGSFLTEDDLKALRHELESALEDWRQRPIAAVTA